MAQVAECLLSKLKVLSTAKRLKKKKKKKKEYIYIHTHIKIKLQQVTA
jgi:hypothetical protein